MTRIVNLNEEGFFYRDRGSEEIQPGDAIIILMRSRKMALQVVVEGTSYYMISVTQSSSEKVRLEKAIFIDGEDVDYVATEDFIVEIGGAVKIENREFSANFITVDWRV